MMSPLLYSASHIHHRGHGTISAVLLGILMGSLLALAI